MGYIQTVKGQYINPLGPGDYDQAKDQRHVVQTSLASGGKRTEWVSGDPKPGPGTYNPLDVLRPPVATGPTTHNAKMKARSAKSKLKGAVFLAFANKGKPLFGGLAAAAAAADAGEHA
jgi:hypothetical protein